ncbi:MAG: PAS domain-containing protein [Propionibacteriaceae bacterium]|jgi:aerotaxis receptor|nr:PAS domain-containing protein [Propionibacteriaceae bacterium]
MVISMDEEGQYWPSLPCNRVPTGAIQEVGVEELFFSTTDLLGVITAANPVFVRLSHFGYRQLMGAPHNIIRHPRMPGGAFKLMWDTLQSGKPFCAYVDNLAANGSTYSVFATITPLGHDAYLSVRSRPMATSLKTAADSLYDATRPVELAARSSGVSARQAAALGLEHLAGLLVAGGIPSYDEFMWTALATEMSLRHGATTRRDRPNTGDPLSNLFATAGRLGDELQRWTLHQQQLQSAIKALDQALPGLRDATDAALVAAREFEDAAAGRFAPLLLSLTVWAQMMSEIGDLTVALGADLANLRSSSAQTVFRSCLAWLHTDTVTQFANELLDGVTVPDYDSGAACSALRLLGQALQEGFAQTHQQEASNASLAAAAAAKIDEVCGLIDIPRSLIENWKTTIADTRDSAVARLLPQVATEVKRADEQLQLLTGLSSDCSAIAEEPPSSSVDAALGSLLLAIRAVMA